MAATSRGPLMGMSAFLVFDRYSAMFFLYPYIRFHSLSSSLS